MPRNLLKSILTLNSDGSLTKEVGQLNRKKRKISMRKLPKRNPANVPPERYAKAKSLWKISNQVRDNPEKQEEAGVKPPLTNEQVETLLGTAYYHLFKEIGWIENPPY